MVLMSALNIMTVISQYIQCRVQKLKSNLFEKQLKNETNLELLKHVLLVLLWLMIQRQLNHSQFKPTFYWQDYYKIPTPFCFPAITALIFTKVTVSCLTGLARLANTRFCLNDLVFLVTFSSAFRSVGRE